MPIQAGVSSPATITAEELTALIAERDALACALRVATTERDLALERLKALQRQLFAAKSEARGTDQKEGAASLRGSNVTLSNLVVHPTSTARDRNPLRKSRVQLAHYAV